MMLSDTRSPSEQRDHERRVEQMLDTKPVITLERLMESLRFAAMRCAVADDGMSIVPVEIVVESFTMLRELDRKLDPKRWTPEERHAFHHAVYDIQAFERLRKV